MTKSKGRLDAARARRDMLFSAISAHLGRAGPTDTATLHALLGMPDTAAKEVLRWARRCGDVVCVGRGPWAKWCLPKDEAAYRHALARKEASRRTAKNLARRRDKPDQDAFRHRVVPAACVKLRLHPRAVRSVFDLADAP